MNKSQFYTLSGALLASTALMSTANAGSIGRINGTLGTVAAVGGSLLSTTAPTIANSLFGGTTAAANAVQFGASQAATNNPIAVSFTNNLPGSSRFNVTIDAVGATMNNPAVGIAILGRAAAGTATFTGTVAGACGSILPLSASIVLTNCILSGNVGMSASMGNTAAIGSLTGGIQLSGIIFTNAAGLATAGGAITMSGSVKDNGDTSIVIETITSGSVVTSKAPIVTSVTAGTTAVTNPATTPAAFKSLSQPTNGSISVTLATVSITASGALGTDLTTLVEPDGGAGQAGSTSVTVTVVSSVFSDDAAVGATMSNAAATATLTPAAFSTGTAAFSLTAAQGYDTAAATQTINVQFDGTHAINAANAGTVTVAYGSSAATGHSAPAGGSGTTAAINSGGFSAEFNTAQNSLSEYQSFIRIHNNGNQAGTVTVTLLNDATGAVMNTWTSGTIAVGQTIQVGMATLESMGSPVITPAANGQYTVQVSGPIIGYAQHVLFNATTGQFSDLSGFRNAGSTANNP
jgi:hypothetical protein